MKQGTQPPQTMWTRQRPVEPDGKWTSPQGWTGPDPALYISFDYPNNLVLMEGSQQKNYDTITSGKVKNSCFMTSCKENL